MAHKHVRGKKIVKRMRRIMKAGYVLSQQLPTEEARKDAESRAKSGESSNEGTDSAVQEG